MSFKDYIKQEFARDPLVRIGKRFFTPRTISPEKEATWHYKQATRYLNYRSRKFDFRLAVEHLKKAIRISPRDANYHCILGQTFLLAPAYAVVRGADVGFSLSRAVELANKEFEKAVRNNPNYSWTYYCMALSHDYMGQREKAKEKCQIALSLSPPKDIKSLLETYLKLLEVPHPDDKAVANSREESLKHLKQAGSYRREGKQRLAIEEFEKGCELAPDSAWLYCTLCQLASASLEE